MSTEEAVAEFGRRLGLDGLAWNEAGRITLELKNLGELTLEKTAGGLRLTLVNAVGAGGIALYEQLLKALHWRNRPLYPAQAAWFRDRLILSVLLTEQGATGAELENALRFAAGEMTRVLRAM